MHVLNRKLIGACLVLVASCDSATSAGVDALAEALRVSATGSLPPGIDGRPHLTNRRSYSSRLSDFFPAELGVAGRRRFADVRLLVSEAGDVMDVEIVSSSGSGPVDAAAIEVALSNRYAPITRDGVPVRVWLEDVRIMWPLIVIDGVPRPDHAQILGHVAVDEIDHLEIARWPAVDEWAGGKVIIITTKGPRSEVRSDPTRLPT